MTMFSVFELQHDKTNKMTCAPSKDSDQTGLPIECIAKTPISLTGHFVGFVMLWHICLPRSHLSHVMRKRVFGVCDQVRLEPACSATQRRESHEIAKKETRDIILSRQRTTKALIRLRRWTGLSVPVLFANTGFLVIWLIYGNTIPQWVRWNSLEGWWIQSCLKIIWSAVIFFKDLSWFSCS